MTQWSSHCQKRVWYQFAYSGCVYPFDDPCDDCLHWVGSLPK